MNFDTIYSYRQKFFPDQIDISDGKEIKETNGFKSDSLSRHWNNAEASALNQAENYFVWAYYRVLHRLAKSLYCQGESTLSTSSISKEELLKEYEIVLKEAEDISDKDYCCDMMTIQLNLVCDLHDSKYDCPDKLVDYNVEHDRFKLIIHDGGSSGIEIKFCPWCGKKLK